ncbi:MAG: antibiotic biosynthesis monooxygenase [Boseongicola sp.]|nr:antibiotic biosynthesis monooxygenase [Boseongicola sp.]
MYVRTSHWRCKPEFADESVKLFRSLVFETMESEPDCLAMQLMGEGEARIAVTVFSSEDAYLAWKARTADLKGITDAFAYMYVDGEAPKPFDYPLLASRVYDRGGPS